MTPEERQLITSLFDRMRGFSLPQKDSEAEALINTQMVSLRDAPYMLVQSVLVQEHALREADSRIKDLEEQVRALQSAQEGAQRPAPSGSFLGGLWGRPAPEPDAGPNAGPSVPTVGSRATPPAYDSRPPAWTPPPASQPPMQPPMPPAPGPQPGGGFLRSAMSTAAGVAGGMLVANAIGNLLGGHAHAAQQPDATRPTDAAGGTADTSPQPSGDVQDAAWKDVTNEVDDGDNDDDGDWSSGDDGGGGDLDI
jgi:hypothetical protein